MTPLLIVGGLSVSSFDRLRRVSEKEIVPGGKLVCRPNMAVGAYDKNHAERLIKNAKEYLKSLLESEEVSILLLYVDYDDETTSAFRDAFFPFCLPHPIQPIYEEPALSKNHLNARVNAQIDNLLTAAGKLRKKAKKISEFTTVGNLTPLLLPLRNFRSGQLRLMLKSLYDRIWMEEDVAAEIQREVTRFLAAHPYTRPPVSGRHSVARCFSDGRLFLKSPGKARHGFLRNGEADRHRDDCLLNARSRLGGAYYHAFHYDCEPCHGRLAAEYDNCHDDPTAPASTHVNIAPNDFIR